MGYETYPNKKPTANSGKLFQRANTATYGIKGCNPAHAKGNYGTKGSSEHSKGGGAGGGGRSRGGAY